MLGREGDDDDLPMGNHIEEDIEDDDLPLDFSDGEDDKINLSWTMIMMPTVCSHPSRVRTIIIGRECP